MIDLTEEQKFELYAKTLYKMATAAFLEDTAPAVLIGYKIPVTLPDGRSYEFPITQELIDTCLKIKKLNEENWDKIVLNGEGDSKPTGILGSKMMDDK